jgi:glutamate dehydrogenase (NAD(P)+)
VVGAHPADSFLRLRTEMQAKVALLLTGWSMDRLPLRVTGLRLVETNRVERAEAALTPEGEPQLLIP